MESAGEKEEKNYTHERYNDEAVIFFYCDSYGGHFKTSLNMELG